MRNEVALRRPDFRPGIAIRLANGQAWTFPAPSASPGMAAEGDLSGRRSSRPDPEYEALIRAVLEAEDEIEGRRVELALAIYLLGQNYDLGPADYSRLLEFPPGNPALAALQRDFHNLAADHLRHSGDRTRGNPAQRARPGFSPLSKAISGRNRVAAR